MTRLFILLAFATACSPPPQHAGTYARTPQGAAKVVADCDAGRRTRDCVAARKGLAEVRRQKRMAAYSRTIREP